MSRTQGREPLCFRAETLGGDDSGRAPVTGDDLGDLLRKVQAGDFPPPRAASPWLDPALEAICLKAMATRPEARYGSPRALAEDVERWVAGEPVAAYPEPLSRRARRWAGRHRTALATAATAATVAAALLGGAAWLRYNHRRRADATALDTLGLADRLATEAHATADLSLWAEAVAEARRALAQLESGGGSVALYGRASDRFAALRAEEGRLRDVLHAAEIDRRARQRERRVVADLDEARLRGANIKNGHYDIAATHGAYLAAFRSFGIDVATLPAEDAAKRVRSSRIADDLISALDDWSAAKPANISGPRLEAIARAAETDPGRAAVRDAVLRRDAAGLRRLCEREQDRRQLGAQVKSAFNALLWLDPGRSLPLLEAIRREHPSDFWLNFNLGMAYQKASPPQIVEAVRCLSVAVALRPESPNLLLHLGFTLKVQGKLDEAVATYRESIRLEPDNAWTHDNLGLALAAQGKHEEAAAAHREAIRFGPDNAHARSNLGAALGAQGKHEEAAAAYREAIRLGPDNALAHDNLGLALKAQGKHEEAAAAHREAIRLKPDYAYARHNLGLALGAQGKHEEAAAAYREAIRLKPDHAYARHNLGLALGAQGKHEEAAAAYREAIRLKPDYPEAYCRLGQIQKDQGHLDDALINLERGHELGSRRPDWRYPSASWVSECRRLVDLAARLPAILKGEATPKDAEERLALATLCYNEKLQAASVRFSDEAFAERPELAADMTSGHRYNAACMAALAGSGQGRDDPPPDEAARAALREKARGWLRADLAAWAKAFDGGDEAAGKKVAATLAHWEADPDLAGIRDEVALSKLPEVEREASRSLWAEVKASRLKATGVAGGGPR